VADDVDSKITIVSPRIKPEEVYPLFVSILESAGCSVIQDGDIYRVVALPKMAVPAAPVVGVHEATPAEGVVTKIFHLEHVSVPEISKVLEAESGGKAGAVGAIEETNHLIVTGAADYIRRIEKIVAEIDQPDLARVTEIVSLRYANAEELASQLNLAMSESETRAEILKKRLRPPRASAPRSGAACSSSPPPLPTASFSSGPRPRSPR